MTAMQWVLVYMAAIAAFFLIDLVWLGVVAQGFYRTQLGGLLADRTNWPVAMLFYLMYLAGLLYFVVQPSLDGATWASVALRGAIFGVITYATFDLTCLALFRDFPAVVAIVDMVWGAVLAGSVSVVAWRVAISLT